MIGRRKRHADPVSAALHDEVIDRDIHYAGGCVAAFLDPEHGCRSLWGEPHRPDRMLTLDHIQTGYGRMGKRAASTPGTLVSICADGHLNGWATSHRPLLREYLGRVVESETELRAAWGDR